VAISDRTPETVAKAIFTRWICRYGVPTEIITNREKEFCYKLTVTLYKAMKLNSKSGCQFPTFYFQEKTANRKIDNYLKQIFELRSTDWKIYLAPLMFSYNTSFNRTFQTSPHFVIFGQHASIQSRKLGEEESGRIFGSGKVSNFANSMPGGLAKCRSSTNEFQNL
jgi:hypothetical protein